MNGLEPLFSSWTGRRKGIPKGVDETHLWLDYPCTKCLASSWQCHKRSDCFEQWVEL